LHQNNKDLKRVDNGRKNALKKSNKNDDFQLLLSNDTKKEYQATMLSIQNLQATFKQRKRQSLKNLLKKIM
jgi:hypothetical protein